MVYSVWQTLIFLLLSTCFVCYYSIDTGRWDICVHFLLFLFLAAGYTVVRQSHIIIYHILKRTWLIFDSVHVFGFILFQTFECGETNFLLNQSAQSILSCFYTWLGMVYWRFFFHCKFGRIINFLGFVSFVEVFCFLFFTRSLLIYSESDITEE
jgi:hypothetical protein